MKRTLRRVPQFATFSVAVLTLVQLGSYGTAEERASRTTTVLGSFDTRKPLRIRRQGSFFVGGRTVTLSGSPDPTIDGDYGVEGTYVHYEVPHRQQYRYPLIMVHGNFSTGGVWESTPDGREGWQQTFLRRGAPVYVPDLVSRGRAGWARPEVWNYDTARFSKMNSAWEGFRVGPQGSYATDPAARQAFDGTQFPIDSFDEFSRSLVPAWGPTHARRLLQPAVEQVIEAVGSSILMTHSQAGPFGWHVAAAHPELVKAIVADEPAREQSGTPLTSTEIDTLTTIPILMFYGDFVTGNDVWTFNRNENKAIADQINAAGGDVMFIDLPEIGIRGNTHFTMFDKNNEVVANLIHCWLVSKDLASEDSRMCDPDRSYGKDK